MIIPSSSAATNAAWARLAIGLITAAGGEFETFAAQGNGLLREIERDPAHPLHGVFSTSELIAWLAKTAADAGACLLEVDDPSLPADPFGDALRGMATGYELVAAEVANREASG